MRLVSMTVEGFRRFAEPALVKLDGHLIAFVGPNEAGKSSILRAATLLNDDAEFDDDDPTREGGLRPAVRAGFLLDPEDLQALDGIAGASGLKYFECARTREGGFSGAVEPGLPRDFGPRQALAERLDGLARTNTNLRSLSKNRNDNFTEKSLDSAVQGLRSEQDFIGRTALKALTALPDAFSRAAAIESKDPDPGDALLDLIGQIESVLELERETPTMKACRVLLGRRPAFLLFDQESRSLARTYDLNKAASTPPKALANLARLAGLDLAELRDAAASDQVGRHTSLIEKSNERLRVVFSDSWVRPEEVPRLNLQGSILHLLVRTADDGYARIDERSDGLRWFVALRAFLSAEESASKPVLLVDEAETHLSYDAQASLIDVLSKQRVAQKVLYTTHSAGCLPADLGTGIRPVVPEQHAERSRIENAFWKEGPGFTPVLLAMGATAFAFTPARNVIIAEGPSECLLLPTLLREATGCESLDFQVAPGLAIAGIEDVPLLDAEGGRVAYLVDGDEGGSLLGQWVAANGVSPRRVVSLPKIAGSGVTLEDLVAVEALVEAVNGELSDWSATDERLVAADLPVTGRSAALEAWCNQRDLSPIRKTSLAQRLAEMRDDQSLVDPTRRTIAKDLHDALVGALQARTT